MSARWKWIGLSATFVHIQAKLGLENLLRMVRWDDTALQTQDLKIKPWRSEAEYSTTRSRRLPTIMCPSGTEMCVTRMSEKCPPQDRHMSAKNGKKMSATRQAYVRKKREKNVRHKIGLCPQKTGKKCPTKKCPQKQMFATRYVRQKMANEMSTTIYVRKKNTKRKCPRFCGWHFYSCRTQLVQRGIRTYIF